MNRHITAVLGIVCILLINIGAGQNAPAVSSKAPSDTITTDIVSISVEKQHDFVNPYSQSALAVHFKLKENWHFYASAENAQGGANLKLKVLSEEGFISFSEPIFPPSHLYFDKYSGKNVEVFSDNFTVHLPFRVADIKTASTEDMIEVVKISIEGAVCSDVQCRMPEFEDLNVKIRISFDKTMGEARFTLPEATETVEKSQPTAISPSAGYSVWLALALAFVAGLSLNIMPCVWPVLPLIVMRIVEQAKQSKGKSIAMGLTFCLGILLFFACLAGANIILKIVYGTVLQWGDQFRSPAVVAGMALLLVVLALFCFGVFTITVPSSISGKAGSGKGYSGAVGMGFLAAILSTPCSFAILAGAFAWAQMQKLPLATLAIMVIGVGMAVPYAILTSIPGLLKQLPKSGRWMELFKQTVGFILLVIAVKLIGALPGARMMGTLYFAIVLSFCVWMWSSWVGYNTKFSRKWFIRIIAIALAVGAGMIFLAGPAGELIDWQEYNSESIETALTEQRPVLIKFTAEWCLSCKVVEKTVYGREDIAKLIEEKNVLVIKADTTAKNDPATLALKNLYNEPGVPVSMLFVPGEKEPAKWRGILFANELKKLLKELPERKESGKENSKSEDKS